jgi:hypothetical protein
MIISLAVAMMIAQATPGPATTAAPAAAPVPASSAAPAAAPAPAASAVPPATPVAATPADAAVATRAKDWLHAIQTGKIDRTQLDAQANVALTDTMLSQASAQLAPLGDPTAFTLTQKLVQGTSTIYLYKVVFPSITLNEIFVLDPDGKIADILLKR